MTSVKGSSSSSCEVVVNTQNMSVVITTSLGDITVDLYTDKCPLTSKNFLKLCKIKYYNGCLFHKIEKDFTAQTGDPTGKGTGGDSIYKFLYGDQARFFNDEIHPDLKHSDFGTVAMASAGKNLNASQFYITLREDLDYLDGEHTVFGKVEEGHDVLKRINEAYVDDQGRPYKNIRIKHTYIIDDPFDDPPQLSIPDRSPEGKPAEEVADIRLEDDWVPLDEQLRPEELEELIREREAHSRAVVLEGVGDIPDAEIKPPENVLFVCKLNPVTQDEDLDTIFSRFGNVISAEIIRDYKTGDSLCYAFIEFESQESCENAYFKMNNALIDDRRIHVDFSQSVAKLWSAYRRGGKNQGAQGKGCFTCGSEDHVAKNCPESKNAKAPPLKYTLKDENTQRGDNAQQRYDMVFDGDHVEASKSRGRRHREHISEDEHRRSKDHRSLGRQHREHDRRDSRSDRGWHDDSHKKYGDVRNHDGNQGSRNHDALRRDTTEDSQRGSEHEGRHDRRDERAGYYDRMNSRDADRDLQNVDKIRRHYSGLHQSREGEDRKNDRGYTTETREGYHDKRNSRVTDRDVQNDVKVRNHHSGLHESREKEDPKRDRGYANETKSDRRHRDERR